MPKDGGPIEHSLFLGVCSESIRDLQRFWLAAYERY